MKRRGEKSARNRVAPEADFEQIPGWYESVCVNNGNAGDMEKVREDGRERSRFRKMSVTRNEHIKP
jgi:hypothetical protein